ncbi:MAG TPA: deoxyribose-phosphate aldolase [Clostridiales bacterium]|nr:deoxyribose-phosphate aldolase [Clostridiales bacterium]
MNIDEVLKYCDHTNLSQTATSSDILKLVKQGEKYGVASVCVAPAFVSFVKSISDINLCTVVGFPNGYQLTKTKVDETTELIRLGADEIDMVININWLKEGKLNDILNEINEVKSACGDKILKVIVETAFLTEEEKIEICNVINKSNADYIKTSTGFASKGATFDDIKLFKKYIKGKKIKAAGGIRTLEDAVEYICLGCDRLGTSSLVKIKEQEQN